MLPTQIISSKSSDTQRGIGLPQYLFLEKHQSSAFSSQLLNLFSYAKRGTHVAFLLFSIKSDFNAVTSINQL